MSDQLNMAVRKAHKNAGLEEGIGLVHRFLVMAYMNEGLSVKKMAGMLLLPVPAAAALKNELKKQKLLQVKSGISLSSVGERFVRERLGYESVDREALIRVINDTDNDSEVFANEIDILNEIYRKRPEADVTIDQALCTAETGINRALLMLRTGGLIGKRVLCAGDDDLTSVAQLLVLRRISKEDSVSGIAGITVFDIDDRVLRYIQDVSREMNTSVQCVRHDFRNVLPTGHLSRYDSVFSDPPYTLEGLKLFISRGASAIKRESELFFYLAFAHKSPMLQLSMQRMLLDAGFVISRIYEHFNKYHGARILGGVSDTLVLQTTANTKDLLPGNYEGPLYTNEMNRSRRIYMCKSCHKQYEIGTGERFVTIERLKGNGCERCGSNVFILLKKELLNKERNRANEHNDQENK